jgi:hypothetical protein
MARGARWARFVDWLVLTCFGVAVMWTSGATLGNNALSSPSASATGGGPGALALLKSLYWSPPPGAKGDTGGYFRGMMLAGMALSVTQMRFVASSFVPERPARVALAVSSALVIVLVNTFLEDRALREEGGLPTMVWMLHFTEAGLMLWGATEDVAGRYESVWRANVSALSRVVRLLVVVTAALYGVIGVVLLAGKMGELSDPSDPQTRVLVPLLTGHWFVGIVLGALHLQYALATLILLYVPRRIHRLPFALVAAAVVLYFNTFVENGVYREEVGEPIPTSAVVTHGVFALAWLGTLWLPNRREVPKVKAG